MKTRRTALRSGALAAALGAVAMMIGVVATPVDASSPPDDDPILVGSTPTTLPELPVPEPPPADNDPEPQTYWGRVIIPAIELDRPLLEGIRLSTFDTGPGHWPGTAMPGELGNVVIGGHRTSHNADFYRLNELVPGDQVFFDLDDAEGTPTATVPVDDPYSGVYTYEVAAVFRVAPDAMWIVGQNYRHEATFFACHPLGSTAERIVVQMDLVAVDGEPLEVEDPPRPPVTATTLLEDA